MIARFILQSPHFLWGVAAALQLLRSVSAHIARELSGNLGLKLLQINMAGETVELSQLPIPHLENLRSQLEEASITLTEGS